MATESFRVVVGPRRGCRAEAALFPRYNALARSGQSWLSLQIFATSVERVGRLLAVRAGYIAINVRIRSHASDLLVAFLLVATPHGVRV